jgi:hypothetical protein
MSCSFFSRAKPNTRLGPDSLSFVGVRRNVLALQSISNVNKQPRKGSVVKAESFEIYKITVER